MQYLYICCVPDWTETEPNLLDIAVKPESLGDNFFLLKVTFRKSKEAGRRKKRNVWFVGWALHILASSFTWRYSEGDESHAGSNTHFNHFFPQFSPSSRPGRGESEWYTFRAHNQTWVIHHYYGQRNQHEKMELWTVSSPVHTGSYLSCFL